jgi:hypothetical protein
MIIANLNKKQVLRFAQHDNSWGELTIGVRTDNFMVRTLEAGH